MTRTPSRYQVAIQEFVLKGTGDGVVQAVPGSGKTTTLVDVANILPAGTQALFCAFNKHIAVELEKKLPRNVKAQTINSLGAQTLRENRLYAALDEFKYRGHEGIVATLATRFFPCLDDEEREELLDTCRPLVDMARLTLTGPTSVEELTLVAQAFNSYRRSPAEHARVVSYMTALCDLAVEYDLSVPGLDATRVVVNSIVEGIKRARGTRDQQASIDFTDQVYLPVVLRLPVRGYDFVFVDEAQDLNRCQLNLVCKARRSGGRMLFVGDRNQCQPPDTMVRMKDGSEKTIADLNEGDEVVTYDRRSQVFVKSGRVNRKAQRWYDGTLYTIKTTGCKASSCTASHKWLVRWTNINKKAWITYLMRKGDRYRVGQTAMFRSQGTEKNATFGLGLRARQEGADAAWVLQVHETQADALAYEQIVSSNYGLPQAVFTPSYGIKHYTQDVIDHIYNSVEGQPYKALQCLRDHGRNINYPLYTPGKNGEDFVDGVRQRQGRNTLFETQACNIISDFMAVPVAPDRIEETTRSKTLWLPISVETSPYQGLVYSLDIERHHKYVANGLVTCNSIYMFAGADCGSMDRIEQVLGATSLPLSICYRCPRSHVALAGQVFPGIEARDNAPAGELSFDVEEDWAVAEAEVTARDYDLQDLFICRNTAPLVSLAYRLIRSGKPAKVRGKKIGEGLTSLVKKAATWGHQNGCKGWENFDAALDGFIAAKCQEARENLKEDKASAAIEALQDKAETIRVINGAQRPQSLTELKDSIIALFDDKGGSTIWLSTIHKAKGLEAERVFLLEPQLLPSKYAKTEASLKQEANLRYIAYSRAKRSLFILRPHEAGADSELAA